MSSARSVWRPALVLLAAACALLTAAIAVAGPASAIEDPRRPSAEITHGPSCGPGVIRVAVINGTRAQRVALVFDGAGEQDSAVLSPGERAELVSADVDWGQTVDVSVTVAATDGTGGEPIEFGTYTRPSAEDCAAISGPGPEVDPPSRPAPWGTTTVGTTTAPTSRSTAPAADRAEQPGRPAGSASAAAVPPGGVVTVRATGFTPGEPVTVSMVGVETPLATVTAAADGSVEAVVQIPRGADPGAAVVELVGGLSTATAGMNLQLTARALPVPAPTTSVPVLAAGVALIVVAGCLGLLAARRSRSVNTAPRR
jgi:hypothetical protein